MSQWLLCGTNKDADSHGFFDKLTSGIKHKMLDEVEITLAHGVTRSAIPIKYDPEIDVTEGDAHIHVGFLFLDNDEERVIRFKLHQLTDDCPWYRLCGNRVRWHLDLTGTSSAFMDRLGLIEKTYMPQQELKWLAQNTPEFYELYEKPLIYNYGRSLQLLKSMYKKYIPLETELNMWKNTFALVKQLTETGSIAQLRQLVASLEDTISTPRRALDIVRPSMGEM